MTTTNQSIESTNDTEKTLENILSNPADTEKRIKKIICEKLGLEEIQLKPGVSFSDDLGVDSLDVFELMIEVENVFQINIPEDDVEKLRGPDTLIAFIQKQKR